MHRFANPLVFMRLANRLYPFLLGGAALALAVGLYGAFFVAPPDYQQGDSMRIMYVHVPAAWLGLQVYAIIAIASAASFVWKHPLADVAARASAPVGAAFTAIALATGALWGKPMWGAYWVWDARLTSVLLLFFLYLGYWAIWDAFDEEEKGAKAARILALVGAVNLPIIKFSVDWWNTLHQPASIMRLDGPTIHSSMLWPLLVMALAFNLYYLSVLVLRMRALLAERKLRNVRLAAAAQPAE